MVKNVTNVFQNITTFKDILEVPNTQTGGYFWFAMTIMFFVVLTVIFLGYGFEIALFTSGFITLIVGLFLVYLDLLNWSWLMLYLGIILFLILYVTWNNRKNI